MLYFVKCLHCITVRHTGKRRGAWGKLKVKGHMEGTDIDMRTLLEGNRKQYDRELTWINLAKNSGGLL